MKWGLPYSILRPKFLPYSVFRPTFLPLATLKHILRKNCFAYKQWDDLQKIVGFVKIVKIIAYRPQFYGIVYWTTKYTV